MKDKHFLDTNIFIYSFDHAHPHKQKKAQHLIDASLKNKNGIISSQVIQEFFNVATKKFSVTMSQKECEIYLEQVLSPLCVIFPSLGLFSKALKLHHKTSYALYDSLILAACIEAKCNTLFSEDLQHSQTVEGVKIINPFI